MISVIASFIRISDAVSNQEEQQLANDRTNHQTDGKIHVEKTPLSSSSSNTLENINTDRCRFNRISDVLFEKERFAVLSYFDKE